MRSSFAFGILLIFVFWGWGCQSKSGSSDASSDSTAKKFCTQQMLSTPTAGSTGVGRVFDIDPMVSSQNRTLSPSSSLLDQYALSVSLKNLTGYGILEGMYVDVVNGECDYSYGAFQKDNQFNYSYGDPRFSEVMDYYYGDQYRSEVDQAGVLNPADPMVVITHCDAEDNAYYAKTVDGSGDEIDLVCIGKSSRFSKADFSHDAHVVVHELQHAQTEHSYNTNVGLGQFLYDEAGALGEAISDFVALAMTEEKVSGVLGFDFLEFSRWALGSFFTKSSMRGARPCPVYDSDYPTCGNYVVGAAGFSSSGNTVSFSYPDGLGWPYAKTVSGPGYLKNTFNSYFSQQEIHGNTPIISGLLWDIYEDIKSSHAQDAQYARREMMKLITQALSLLPQPSPSNLSPVTFIGFAEKLYLAATNLSWDVATKSMILNQTNARGLTGFTPVAAGWAEVGLGSAKNPGLRFIDTEPQNGTSDEYLNPGDIGALFFDVKNTNATTAGGILVDVEVINPVPSQPDVIFLGAQDNYGYLSETHSMIHYGKINGTGIVTALGTGGVNYRVPTGNTFFKTDPLYDGYGDTALWIQVTPDAVAGHTVQFQVKLTPANGSGAVETLTYTAEIK